MINLKNIYEIKKRRLKNFNKLAKVAVAEQLKGEMKFVEKLE